VIRFGTCQFRYHTKRDVVFGTITSTVSVPPVRYHLDHFGTNFYFENCSSLHCTDCSANKGRCSLFNVWYRNRPGTELDLIPKRYWYRTGYRLVLKRTGTEVVTWYQTRPFGYRNGLVPNASGTERDLILLTHGSRTLEQFGSRNGGWT